MHTNAMIPMTKGETPENRLTAGHEECEQNTEIRILKNCQAGDWSEFNVVVERYQRLVCAAVCAAAADSTAMPDLVQETFIRVYEKLHTFKFRCRFSSWVYRIARNIALNHLRTLSRRPATASLEQRMEYRSLFVAAASEQGEPWSAAEKEAKKGAVTDMIGRLPVHYREVIYLYYLRELSYESIAEALALPLNTVRTRLRRGRERLIELANKEGWHE